MMENIQERAIAAAARFVARRGYEVLATSWKGIDGGSVDMIAKDGNTLVFFDIEAREGCDKGLPADDAEGKRERMEIDAAKWLAAHSYDDSLLNARIRFDMIAMVTLGRDRAMIRHHVNALSDAIAIPAA